MQSRPHFKSKFFNTYRHRKPVQPEKNPQRAKLTIYSKHLAQESQDLYYLARPSLADWPISIISGTGVELIFRQRLV